MTRRRAEPSAGTATGTAIAAADPTGDLGEKQLAPGDENVDILAGINARTTKHDLLARLEKAAGIFNRMRTKDLKRTAEIERRVHEKWSAAGYEPLYQITVQASEAEFRAALDCLADLEEVAPPVLQRFYGGVKTLLEDAKAETKKGEAAF